MSTVERIIEILSQYPKDMKVTNEQNLPFIYIVNRQGEQITLSTKQPIGFCNTCGDYVYKEDVIKKYKGICTTCDENKFNFEIIPLITKFK